MLAFENRIYPKPYSGKDLKKYEKSKQNVTAYTPIFVPGPHIPLAGVYAVLHINIYTG